MDISEDMMDCAGSEETVAKEEASMDEESIDDTEDTFDDHYIEELPHQLRRIRNMVFESHHQLEEEIRKRGFGDLNVQLHPVTRKPLLKETCGAHDWVTSIHMDVFNQNYKPSWGVALRTPIVFMQPTGIRKRWAAGLAFWGPAKCCVHRWLRAGGAFLPKYLVQPPIIFGNSRECLETVNPDVVVHVGWGNSDPYEFEAINDLMNHVLVTYPQPQPDNEAPRLGFLIKIRLYGKKRTHNNRRIIRQIDVYRLPQGTTVADAEANRDGASLNIYEPGGADVKMYITAADLGVTNPGNLEPFCMSAEDIYTSLK